MKPFSKLFRIIGMLIVASCSEPKPQLEEDFSRLEEIIRKAIPDLCAYSTVYVVHPENCGACSEELLKKVILLSEKNKCIFLLRTGSFEKVDSLNTESIKSHFIHGDSLYRQGVSSMSPEKIEIAKWKIISLGPAD